MSDRTISSCSHRFVGTNCKKCGVYHHPSDPSIKTSYYDSYLNCSSDRYLKHMRKRVGKTVQSKQIYQSTYNLLQSICEKFQYTLETLSLGIYLYGKISKNHEKDQKFWASVCLIAASKGIQLDKRVPYLNRYQRYAQKTFSQQDYELAEKTIFQQLDFDIQFVTFVSFLNFYITNGVIFKSDCINSAILKYVQDDMIQKAKDFIKTGEFLGHNPQKLALSIIKQIRMKFRLQPWRKQLEIVSGFSDEDIKLIQKSSGNILKPVATINTIPHKPRDKLTNISLGSMSINSLQMSLNLTQQKIIKPNKKKFESAIKFQSTLKIINIKENTNKIRDQLPLATLRNQALSTNKYMNGLFFANSDKIVPLNSFITKRM